MMRWLLIVIVSLFLVGCTDKQLLRGNGAHAPPPIGATIGCINNPTAAYCQDEKP